LTHTRLSPDVYVPSEVFVVSGVGRHDVGVASFERALRDAGVEPYNLVPVSSVVPPDASFVDPRKGAGSLDPGQVVHAVLGRDTVSGGEDEGEATAAVGVALPDEGHGYFVERSGVDRAGDEAETLAREMVETSDSAGEVVESFAEEERATADGDGLVTAVVAAVLVP